MDYGSNFPPCPRNNLIMRCPCQVFLMTVTSGIPPTDNTPILSIYYATVMVLTTGATILGVIVLRIHHQGRRGLPVPPYLRRMGQWMAVITFSNYPPVEAQLANLTTGHAFGPPPRKETYCYNIKEELRDYGKGKDSLNFSLLKKTVGNPVQERKMNHASNTAKKVARFRPRATVETVSE